MQNMVNLHNPIWPTNITDFDLIVLPSDIFELFDTKSGFSSNINKQRYYKISLHKLPV
jgi:hypothetical protein